MESNPNHKRHYRSNLPTIEEFLVKNCPEYNGTEVEGKAPVMDAEALAQQADLEMRNTAGFKDDDEDIV